MKLVGTSFLLVLMAGVSAPLAAQSGRGAQDPWISMAFDYDRDGRIDEYELIHRDDLERARQSSNREQQRSERPPIHQIRGQILDTRTIRFVGQEEEHILARLRTRGGGIERVDLGPASALQHLDLGAGSPLVLFATEGTINDKPMMIAHEIGNSEGTQEPVDRHGQRPLKQVRGQILDTRTAMFSGFDREFLLATVRTEDGESHTVNFGPDAAAKDLQSGKEISFLAREVEINGETGLAAIKIKNDESERVSMAD